MDRVNLIQVAILDRHLSIVWYREKGWGYRQLSFPQHKLGRHAFDIWHFGILFEDYS